MTNLRIVIQSGAALTAFFAFGCSPAPILDRDWPDAYWRTGDYALIAIDTQAQMSLKADFKDGSRTTFVHVVDATVFAVGSNDRYIVAKQHPLIGDSQTQFDRGITNYFVVDRTTPPTLRQPQKGATGPLTQQAFEQMAAKVQLPPFTKIFRKLEGQSTD